VVLLVTTIHKENYYGYVETSKTCKCRNGKRPCYRGNLGTSYLIVDQRGRLSKVSPEFPSVMVEKKGSKNGADMLLAYFGAP